MAEYGVLERENDEGEFSRNIEQLRVLGYTTLDSGFSAEFRQEIRRVSVETADLYREKYSGFNLNSMGEANSFRAPAFINPKFLEVANHPQLRNLISQLISGKFYLNQQNLVINPPKSTNYSQLRFHRDLPYQHYVSSRPLAINALYAVDDFTIQNGATYILPATHKVEKFPSENFINENQIQVEVTAGTFLILDCMLYHAAAPNMTSEPRIGLNHVFSTVMFRPQINMASFFETYKGVDDVTYKELLGVEFNTPNSVSEYLTSRQQRLG